MDKRRFIRVWGDGYECSDEGRAHYETDTCIEAFDVDSGYNQKEIEQVEALRLGEGVCMSAYDFHTVVRIA